MYSISCLDNLSKIRFEYRENANCTSPINFYFECKRILLFSVLPWQERLYHTQTMCTNIIGNSVNVQTNNGGAKVFAVIEV